ncbi:hypothetical protein JW926_16005 [Candidatus Sumerlaeota bacterium]|nr:hypothetical protein [Candidatus Sumerlaeota bacterium]
MFGRIFAKFFWDAYDYLGRLVLANILFFLIIMGITIILGTLFYPLYYALGRPVLPFIFGMALIAVFTLPFPASGFLYFLSLISKDKEPEFRDFFRGIKHSYWALFRLCLVFAAIFLLLGVNIFFYLNPDIIPPSLKTITLVISGICVWIFLYLIAMMMYAFPLTVYQKAGIRKTLFRSFLLVTDNIGVTILAILLLGVIVALGLVTRGMTFFVLNIALIASLANSLYDNVMKKYEAREAEKQKELESKHKPGSWKEIKHKEFIEDRHDRYHRTLKDILKPWEY